MKKNNNLFFSYGSSIYTLDYVKFYQFIELSVCFACDFLFIFVEHAIKIFPKNYN